MSKRKADVESAGSGLDQKKFKDRAALFARNLKSLNSQFRSWVDQQQSDHPDEFWIDGAEDYVRYAKQMLTDFDDVINPTTSGAGTSAKQPALDNAGAPFRNNTLVPSLAQQSAQDTPGAPFQNNTSGKPAEPKIGLFGSSTWTTATTTPLFGNAAFPNTFTTTGGSTPVVESQNTHDSAGGFHGFSTSQGGGEKETDCGEDGETEELPEEEPGGQVQLENDDTEFLFKEAASLHEQDKKEGKWISRGSGTLTVRKPKAGGAVYVVFTAASGRVFLQARIPGKWTYKYGKTKNQVMAAFIAYGDASGVKPCLFKFRSEDMAERFVAVVEEHVPRP